MFPTRSTLDSLRNRGQAAQAACRARRLNDWNLLVTPLARSNADACPARRPGGVFIALGANLGDRAATLEAAIDAIAALPGVQLLRRSSLHETEPVGGPPGQPPYLNAVIEIDCSLDPHDLLRELLAIEGRFGRTRSVRNAPRTLDLDLLAYGDVRMHEPDLTLPHPRMWQREFVLAPLGEIADVEKLRQALGPERPGAEP